MDVWMLQNCWINHFLATCLQPASRADGTRGSQQCSFEMEVFHKDAIYKLGLGPGDNPFEVKPSHSTTRVASACRRFSRRRWGARQFKRLALRNLLGVQDHSNILLSKMMIALLQHRRSTRRGGAARARAVEAGEVAGRQARECGPGPARVEARIAGRYAVAQAPPTSSARSGWRRARKWQPLQRRGRAEADWLELLAVVTTDASGVDGVGGYAFTTDAHGRTTTWLVTEKWPVHARGARSRERDGRTASDTALAGPDGGTGDPVHAGGRYLWHMGRGGGRAQRGGDAAARGELTAVGDCDPAAAAVNAALSGAAQMRALLTQTVAHTPVAGGLRPARGERRRRPPQPSGVARRGAAGRGRRGLAHETRGHASGVLGRPVGGNADWGGGGGGARWTPGGDTRVSAAARRVTTPPFCPVGHDPSTPHTPARRPHAHAPARRGRRT
eukprot:6206593-Pleurochrysis_carterae.AAC.3